MDRELSKCVIAMFQSSIGQALRDSQPSSNLPFQVVLLSIQGVVFEPLVQVRSRVPLHTHFRSYQELFWK